MEAYLINPVGTQTRKARGKSSSKRRKVMAKRKQPAALRKYWAAKKAGKAAKKHHKKSSRKVSRRKVSHRKKHWVKKYHRKAAHVKSYNRKGAWVKRHLSNPLNIGGMGGAAINGLVAVGVFFGALFVVGYANGLVKRVPMLAAGWGELAGKLALAIGVGVVAARFGSRYLSGDKMTAVKLAAFAPLGLALLNRFVPQIAGQITLAEDEDEDMGAELAMSPGHRLSDYTIDAELAAELAGGEKESESSMY